MYRARLRAVTCHRVVAQNPAQVGDFLSFAEMGASFEWWDLHRAVGVSHWEDAETAAAVARGQGKDWLAVVDLSRADGRTPWAYVGRRSHITVWAPPPVLLAAVVDYVQV